MTAQEALIQASQRFHAGATAEAEAICHQIIAHDPLNADAHHLIGLSAMVAGRSEDAIRFIARAIELRPDVADYHVNMGVVLGAVQRYDQAEAAYERALALNPNATEASNNLADIYCRRGEWEKTIEKCRTVLLMRPTLPEALCNFGVALQQLGKLEEAVTCYQRALQARPNHFQSMLNMGNALIGLGRLDAAISVLGKSALLSPNHPSPQALMGAALLERGGINNAMAAFDRAIALAPAAPIVSSRLAALEYHSDFDAQSLLRECRAWDVRFAQPLRETLVPHSGASAQGRRLRIGYVSPDFSEGAIGRWLLPLLRERDRAGFEIFCYACSGRTDELTATLKSSSDTWRDISRLTDLEAADLIRTDGVDLLVDLALHGAGNRLPIFARRPAPVQVCFLGSVGTTGLSTMDWRLSDPCIDPPNTDLSCYSERTQRLPRTYWAYEPAGDAPEVGESPVEKNGYLTYGCLGRFIKSAGAIELWGDILSRVPDSRLVLHCPEGSARRRVEDLLAAKGVKHHRVQFAPRRSWTDYMADYQRIDIALDPRPYSEARTICDALWMGVPVISLSGLRAAGRRGESVLVNAGLAELVAHSADEYVRIATNWQPLIPLRQNLRERIKASPLMDLKAWVNDVEEAYRRMATGSVKV